MFLKRFFFFILFLIFSLLLSNSFADDKPLAKAVLLNINGAIGPATQDYVHQGFVQAAKEQAEIIILQIDTPGGLDKAMRGIISDILASPIPVIAYVAPSGARAASAGTYILYASQIAAMAPGTNLGAATPVNIGLNGNGNSGEKNKTEKSPSDMEKKMRSDAQAYMRSLAQLRGRNMEWAEKAVNEGASLSANEALQLKVIDVIANNIPDLLQKINGRNVSLAGNQQKVLHTAGLNVQVIEPSGRSRFLAIITDPSVAYILLIIGMWGIFFEFASPGFVLPGVIGAICLLLALYAFQLLPINYVGFALILLGIAFLISEAFISSFGVLGVGGIIAFVMGSIFLFESGAAGYHIALPLILAVSGITAGFFLLVINLALKARFKPVVSGREELIGSEGIIVLNSDSPRARIRGELWQVRCETPLVIGQKVKVVGIEGLVLIVVPI